MKNKSILRLNITVLQSHKDLQGLKWAKECMVDVSQYINEVKRDFDTFQILNDVQVVKIKRLSDYNLQ